MCLRDLHEYSSFCVSLGTSALSACTSGGLRLVIEIILEHHSSCSFTVFIEDREGGSQSNPEMICQASLASQLALAISCFCLLRVEL